MKIGKKISILILSLYLFMVSPYLILAFSSENLVRAKIGIQIKSGSHYSMAKSRDHLKQGDLLRIYVHPEKASYIYVIYSDKKKAIFLNRMEQKKAGSTLVLPGVDEYYQIDGQSNAELFTIICSPWKISGIDALSASDLSHEKWMSIEQELIKKNKIILTEKSTKPFAIAGNVRGNVSSAPNGTFKSKLRIYSGDSLVVKQYEFTVKK